MLDAANLRLPYLSNPQPDLLCAGMPSAEDFRAVAAAGVRTVVNLCQLQETPIDEPEFVQHLGMRYVQIPIGGAPDLSETNARALAAVIDDKANQPVLVHCMSSNRVGALLALKAGVVDRVPAEEAMQFGLQAGLRALEPVVWHLLTHHQRATS